jgi:hypothetical protein
MMNRNNNQKAWEGTMILTSSIIDVNFDSLQADFETLDFEQADKPEAIRLATEQAAEFDCAVNFVNETSYGGDYRVQYSGTKENLDILFDEIGIDAESMGYTAWVVNGTSYTLVD